MILKRIFDVIFAATGIIITSPFLILIAIFIVIDSKGGAFYVAKRIGKNEKEFNFIKFRTMKPFSDNSSITVGDIDDRITRVGRLLRKTKLDELPQLFNVILGQISFVGPRPDVVKYSEFYKKIFPDYYKLKPGITSYSSIYFVDESELYIGVDNPEKKYIEYTIPKKIELDKKYFENTSILQDFKIILLTFVHIIRTR